MIVIVCILFFISFTFSLVAMGKWFYLDRIVAEVEQDIVSLMKTIEELRLMIEK